MINRRDTVARIVLEHSECAPVFQKHRIDYCCKGSMTLEEACAARELDTTIVLAELDSAIAARRGSPDQDPRELNTPALVGHIMAHHHEYLRKALPFIQVLSKKVARVHGDHNPKLRDVDGTVEALVEALMPHLEQEEEVLFPALMTRGGDKLVIQKELATMHEDHLEVGGMLDRLRTAADEFVTPDWACNSYRTLFAELEALEADILRHVHLENHVLMPRFAAA